MADEKFECPGCGRWLRSRDHAPFWTEARARTEGRLAPSRQPAKNDRCRICGGPLLKSRRVQKGKVSDLPTVLPAEEADDAADVPTVSPADEEDRASARPATRPPRRPAHPAAHKLPVGDAVQRDRQHRKDAMAGPGKPYMESYPSRTLGPSPFLWSLIGVGAAALLLLPLSLFFFVNRFPAPIAAPNNQEVANRAPPPAHEPPPAVKLPGLLAYWSFDEGDGTRAADSSSTGLHATLVKARWTDGIRGKALSLDGPGSYLDYGDSPHLSFAAGASFTIAFWTRTTRPRGTLLSQRHSHDGSAIIDILIADGKVQAQVRQDGNEVSGPATVNGGIVNDGAWHHVALTREGDRIELFLDSVSQGQKAGNPAGGAITTDLHALGAERYWISKRSFGDPHFQGDMDEFCIFNRALNADEIKTLAGR